MLSEADRQAVLAFSEPRTDSMLDGWNAGDYAAFSNDFSEEVVKSMPSSSSKNSGTTNLPVWAIIIRVKWRAWSGAVTAFIP